MNKMINVTYYNGDEYKDFNFYTDISVAKKQLFVNSVVDLVIDDGNYNSIIRQLVFDFFLIDVFTDIDMSNFKKSECFLDDVEEFLGKTDIVYIIKENMADDLLDNLNKAVDLSIEYKTGIHRNSLEEALSNLVGSLEKKINEIDLNSMMGMATKFSGMTDELTVDNIVEAYMNSDIHKKNLEEITEAKKMNQED